ncbi:4-hydroxythreonine-4-phosphate dehydrogenase PdxA [Verrucomicrobiales bacterium]|nr:4-hydroxythreonine-4-phosphate dehydrogenase PdxA [Verrucomicrobiales bacterium]MDA7614778.1 4-hydroxythreonine-4-phosphate dehydrogenase PdxA [Verrucomicrobiales bacterium]MDA7666227.1 4-hydroxythreonine-4-phosphate dehydrogenase PdxA [bacterium]MDB4808530.1 4-hydroxythreonine-4-phosphate dehydrogenase PdxA [Verrucomicrobiales bacterium]
MPVHAPDHPTIAITMGDPAGVGPEICLRALANESLTSVYELRIYGNQTILQRVADATGLKVDPMDERIIDFTHIDVSEVTPGIANGVTGAASHAYIQSAIDAALTNDIAAIVTAPINKEALHAAGISHPGHTEIFAERSSSDRWCMMQYSEPITCTFVTVHVGYSEVPALLTQQRILEVIELTHESLTRIEGKAPHIVVCGLNPHAGEHGLFGNQEEERLIAPAIEAARQAGMSVEGPLPPDTVFVPAKRATTDAVVCMYHDQGHIPVKALAFDCAVNTTLGLPIIRTSVDHGTALDIAWQGKANPGSLFSAIHLAARLSRNEAPR